MNNNNVESQATNHKKMISQEQNIEATETECETSEEFLDFELDDIEVIESKVFA